MESLLLVDNQIAIMYFFWSTNSKREICNVFTLCFVSSESFPYLRGGPSVPDDRRVSSCGCRRGRRFVERLQGVPSFSRKFVMPVARKECGE
jgi:hypothetical protein